MQMQRFPAPLVAVLFLVFLSPAVVSAQVSPQEPPVDSVNRLVDVSAPVSERLASLRQVSRDAGLVDRPELVSDLEQILVNRRHPADLRLAILGELTQLHFPMTHASHEGRFHARDHAAAHRTVMEFNDLVRQLIDDPDPRLVRSSLSWLAIFQDEAALERVAAFLAGGAELPLATDEALGLLTFVDASRYLPLIYRVYQSSDDPTIREEALRVLADHEPARNDLREVAKNPEEPPELRTIALTGLHSADLDNFPELAAPLLANPEASGQVKAHAISLMLPVRSVPPYRQRKLEGFDDDFDAAVRRLAAYDDRLGKLARVYLLETDPTWMEQRQR